MLSLFLTPNCFCIPHNPVSSLNAPSSAYPVLKTKIRAKIARKGSVLCGFVGSGRDIFGFFLEVRKGGFRESSWCCRCKERWESEGDSELEAEILEFMEKSSNPRAFPSKKELVQAGRRDLVEAIKNRGGWLSMGWESESEDEANEGESVGKYKDLKLDFELEDFKRRVGSFMENATLEENDDGSNGPLSEGSSTAANQPASSSGRTLKNEIEGESGIDGILSRLEKERNSSFGIDVGISKYLVHPGNYKHSGTPKDVDMTNEGGIHGSNTKRGKLSNVEDGKDSHYTKQDTWRSWSLNRAGFNDTEFEADEIPYGDNQIQNNGETSIHEDVGATTAADGYKALHKWNLTNTDPIQTRLQHLQLELSSVLHLLKSESEEIDSKKVVGNSPNDLQSLSDALEFQQNEVMSSHEKLRSLRAKLAILEGKMALALVDARKILAEKQMRIDSASRSLELLRTACIVWPNSASEVLLVGSFDGWMTQRKMKKSKTGIFSVSLKLYPGRYEIKFIVDGKWRVDPLRPIVFNNGYENNLLIIPEQQTQNSEPLGTIKE